MRDAKTSEEVESAATGETNSIEVDLEGIASFFVVALDENKNERNNFV